MPGTTPKPFTNAGRWPVLTPSLCLKSSDLEQLTSDGMEDSPLWRFRYGWVEDRELAEDRRMLWLSGMRL